MIPTIATTEKYATVENDNYKIGIPVKVNTFDLEDIELLQVLRTTPTINGVVLDDFFADIEDRRSPVLIRGTTYQWVDVAHIFHDLDA
jgi:hypothetical protein